MYEVSRADPPESFWKELSKRAKNEGGIFCRISPMESPLIKGGLGDLIRSKFPSSKSHGQRFPEATRMIDLTLSEEEIFAQFSSTCRRHIRIAEKNGVKVIESDDLKKYTELSHQTAGRDGFFGHSLEYFQKFFEAFREHGKLLVAIDTSSKGACPLVREKEEKWLSAGIFVFLEDTGVYYYGASSNEHREWNAPTFLQWEAMKLAKKMGCKKYDLLGIAPDDNPKHPLAGVTQFKKKFGGEVIHYFPETNVVFSRFWYGVYRLGKWVRKVF